MKQTYYIPVSLAMLPEYFSSGFIGLPASREPDEDIQSIAYPNLLVVNSTSVAEDAAFFEIETEYEAKPLLDEHFANLKLVEGPVSIAWVKRVLFSSEEEMRNFESSYTMMPDMPLELFEFALIDTPPDSEPALTDTSQDSELPLNDTSPDAEFELTDTSQGSEPPLKDVPPAIAIPNLKTALKRAIKEVVKPRRMADNPGEIASLVIGAGEALSCLNSGPNPIERVKITRANKLSISKGLVKEILLAVKCHDVIPSHSFELLEIYFNAVNKAESKRKLFKNEIFNAMTSLATKKLTTGDEETDDKTVIKFIEKSKNIMLGLHPPPDLDDDKSELALQRAVYLACIAEDLNAFETIKKNLAIGRTVESIAKVLVSYRTTLAYISKETWRSTRQGMDGVLMAAETILAKKEFSLAMERLPNRTGDSDPEAIFSEDFNFHQKLIINEVVVEDRLIHPEHDFTVVIAALQALGYEPRPSEVLNRAKFDVRASADRAFQLNVAIGICPLNKQNYKISGSAPISVSQLGRKQTRDKVFEIANEYMVVPGFAQDGDSLEFSRYQWASTMDRDELLHHVQLVQGAISSIQPPPNETILQ